MDPLVVVALWLVLLAVHRSRGPASQNYWRFARRDGWLPPEDPRSSSAGLDDRFTPVPESRIAVARAAGLALGIGAVVLFVRGVEIAGFVVLFLSGLWFAAAIQQRRHNRQSAEHAAALAAQPRPRGWVEPDGS